MNVSKEDAIKADKVTHEIINALNSQNRTRWTLDLKR